MRYRMRRADDGSRIQKVFIWDENSNYREISYEEFSQRRLADPEFAKKRFLCLHHMLQEVSEDDYKDFYKARRHVKYLREKDAEHQLLSLDVIGAENVDDKEPDIIDTVCRNEECARLRMSLAILKDTDSELGELLELLFFKNMTERAAAEIFGLSQKGVNKRKKRALERMKKILKNF